MYSTFDFKTLQISCTFAYTLPGISAQIISKTRYQIGKLLCALANYSNIFIGTVAGIERAVIFFEIRRKLLDCQSTPGEMKHIVTPRGLFITLLYVFAATELTFTVLSQSLPTEQADSFDGAIDSVRIVGEGSEGFKSHSFREAATGLILNDRIIKEDRVPLLQTHDVIFVIKQRNLDELTQILHDISDPESVRYGQHMSAMEIADLTRNPGSRSSVVNYLNASGASIVSETLYSEYITARASVQVWEQMFDTEFYTYALHPLESDYGGQSDESAIKRVVRAEEYSVPTVLDAHVTSVMNTVQLIPLQSPRLSIPENMSPGSNAALNGSAYPAILNAAYNIDSNIGHPRATQAVFETINQTFSPNDLAAFQQQYGLPLIPVNRSIGGHAQDSYCIKDVDRVCYEGNADVQYIMAVSQSPTTYFYMDSNSSFADFVTLLANMTNPPLVVSVSYINYEIEVHSSELDAFNVQAIKLGAMGVTLVVSSGDNGVTFFTTNYSECSYEPTFLSTSPYVLSIGGTKVCL